MKHTNYQPAKPGILAGQILQAKRLRVMKNLSNQSATDDLIQATKVGFQRARLSYSDRGDFTRCYRGGF